ncbi:MAG: flagellar biosynthesis protein FlhA [Bryobacteraceae bacterium]|nr:flagellar biosynthesis protein FlhA [Bryobacteraceae bacterium]
MTAGLPAPPASPQPLARGSGAGPALGGLGAASGSGGLLLFGVRFAGMTFGELGVPLAVLGILLAMITPLPAFALDLLISANITLSVVVLLVSMHILKPVEFSIFPTTLLLMTLFRLALNVSSSRLILLNGNAGTVAAGEVIEAFGQFVVGGNYIVGVVIFLVLIAIQYVVINHGAVRISEVTARFTLDALPGKQMSIDSDLNAGLIDETEARTRRKMLAAEAEFYGAMDGASRFTQRDAVASILITAINILAGILIGIVQHGMDVRRALETYTVLTIGDGLVTVIPALMISISGALIVTRASSDGGLAADFQQQLFRQGQPLLLAAAVLLAMAAFPGLPKIPFLVLGAGVGVAAWRIQRREAESSAGDAEPAAAPQPKENLESLLKVDTLSVEVGLGLVRLAEGGPNSPLLRRISAIRRQMAAELGFILPPIRVTDNLSLRASEYVISLKGIELSRFEIPPGHEMAVPGPRVNGKIDGAATREPAFGMAAVWIASSRAEAARSAGYTVVDAVSILGTHLGELVRRHAYELFSRQDAKKFIDRVVEENPKLVEDLVPKLLPLAAVQKVVQNLLRERVSIRDGASILEALGEAANLTRNPVVLTEYVRQSLRRTVAKPYLSGAAELHAYFLDAGLERMIEAAVEHGENASHISLAPPKVREILDRLGRILQSPDTPVVVLCGSGCRYFVRQIAESSYANLVALAHNEVPPGVKVVSLGTVGG